MGISHSRKEKMKSSTYINTVLDRERAGWKDDVNGPSSAFSQRLLTQVS